MRKDMDITLSSSCWTADDGAREGVNGDREAGHGQGKIMGLCWADTSNSKQVYNYGLSILEEEAQGLSSHGEW